VNDLASLVPQALLIVFRARGAGASVSGFYTVPVTLASLSIPQYFGIVGAPWNKVLRRYEIAEYNGGGSPVNAADLIALARQLAYDWYRWQLGSLEQQFVAIVPWTPEGYHDLEWRQESEAGKIVTELRRFVFNPMEDLLYQANSPLEQEQEQSCEGCGWLADIPITTCLEVRMMGGYGRCGCIDFDEESEAVKMVYVNQFGKWMAIGMEDTCCGCGAVFLAIDAPNEGAFLEFSEFHVACEHGGSGAGDGILFSMDLDLVCCARNPVTGIPYATFVGFGSNPCSGDQENCRNEFYVRVNCAECPPAVCGCCCADASPPAWYYFLAPGAPGGSFDDNHWNGYWVLTHTDDCTWEGVCNPPNGTTHTVVLQLVTSASPPVWRLTHDGAVYELTQDLWGCGHTNIMPRVSSTGNSPNTISINPLFTYNYFYQNACELPDSLTVAIESPTCPGISTVQVVTKVPDGSVLGYHWEWTNPTPSGDYVATITVDCYYGILRVFATGSCDGAPPMPISVTTGQAQPDSEAFDPFEATWSNCIVGTLGPSTQPQCCAFGSLATITVTE